MKVRSVELHRVRIPFKGAFTHALKQRTEAEAVLVRITSDEGVDGWGEIVPRPYLTGETIESVFEQHAPARASRMIGTSVAAPDQLAELLNRELSSPELATIGGFELALLDVAGRELSFPASRVLGAPLGAELPAGVVIGFEVSTSALPKHCALLKMSGKKHVKVKVGLDDDLARLEIISARFGDAVPLRLDANAAWTVERAIENLNAMRRFNIASIEQPIASRDFEGMRRIREETGFRVMADESLCSARDAERLISEKAADVFNVRVGKCGGFLGSRRIVDLARSAGIALHLGALVGETAILSRAGELFGRSVPEFDCFEGKGQNKFLLADDVARPGPGGDDFRGLGIEVDPAKVSQYSIASARFERDAA